MGRRERRKVRWLAVRLFADHPNDGWDEAWATALMIRKMSCAVLEGRELTEAELFQLEVEMDLARLPIAEWVRR